MEDSDLEQKAAVVPAEHPREYSIAAGRSSSALAAVKLEAEAQRRLVAPVVVRLTVQPWWYQEQLVLSELEFHVRSIARPAVRM